MTAARDLARLRLQAWASRRAGHAVPVVETQEEALRLAETVARGLADLSEEERLDLLSDLDVIGSVLSARLSWLEREMAAARGELTAVNQGCAAMASYLRAVTPAARRKG